MHFLYSIKKLNLEMHVLKKHSKSPNTTRKGAELKGYRLYINNNA